MSPASGFISPRASLRIVLFPEPATPKIALVSPFASWKEMSFKTVRPSNAIETLSKEMTGDREASVEVGRSSKVMGGAAIAQRYEKIAIRNLVASRSTKRIKTEDATTAWVVARPTP